MVATGRSVPRKRKASSAGPPLPPETLLEMYYKMCLSRALDDRVWILAHSGEIGLAVSAHGHEAMQVGSIYAIRGGYDWVAGYYRDGAAMIALGVTPRQYMLAFFAKADDPSSGGRQFPAHWSFPELNVITRGSNVATQILHGAGIALASKMKREDRITITYFGDGSTSKGDFHEALNFAGLHKLPVIFFCENNEYAISVPRSKQMPIKDISIRAAGYGMPGVSVDGRDVFAVYQATSEAAALARSGGGPTLLVANGYRLTPHTSNDPDKTYRTREEFERFQHTHDPVPIFRRTLMETGVLDEAKDKAFAEKIAGEVEDATDFARNAADPVPEQALRYVYAEGEETSPLQERR